MLPPLVPPMAIVTAIWGKKQNIMGMPAMQWALCSWEARPVCAERLSGHELIGPLRLLLDDLM